MSIKDIVGLRLKNVKNDNDLYKEAVEFSKNYSLLQLKAFKTYHTYDKDYTNFISTAIVHKVVK